MIIFEKVRFKNFLSYGNSFTEISLNSYHTTAIFAKNGSGKSVFLDSITFALFGKPFRKINKPGLINSINKSELVVELEFSSGKKQYKIIRGLKPNIFELYCNGSLIKQDAAIKDYQEYLEKYILKTNFKSFTQVCILGSARYSPFMQLSAADRRTVIEDLLDIQIFSNMNILVKDKLSELKENISSCKYNIELYKDKIELQKHNIEEHKKSSKELIFKKQELLDKTFLEIEELQFSVEELNQNNEELLTLICDKTSIESKKQKLTNIEVKLKQNLKSIEKDIEFYQQNDSCPTCKQTISEEFKQTVVENSENKKKELISGAKKLVKEVEQVRDRLIEISSINNIIANNNIEIAKVNSSISSTQKYSKIISKELEELHTKTSCLEEDNEKLQELVESLDKFVESYEEYVTEKSYYDFISIILKDGGIKTKIIKQYLPLLNKYINHYLSKMEFFVNFNVDENFNEVIKSRNRDEFQYTNFSEGEKMRIDLSVLLAFRQLSKLKNSVNCNLLIFDEIMDSSLDSSGTDIFMDIIKEFDKNTNIFVISHKQDQIIDKFSRVIRIEKTKNFSKLKEI